MNLQDIKKSFDENLKSKPTNTYEDKRLNDSFIDRYGKPNVLVDQLVHEFEALLTYFLNKKPNTILEIGTHQGGTLWYWVKYAPENATIISIDIDHTICKCWDELRSMRPDIDLILLTGNSKDPKIIEQAFNITDQFDFCFIDGEHIYSTVKNDWEVYGKKSKITAFHDIATGPGGVDDPEDVRILWNEITSSYRNKFISLIEGPEPGHLCYGIGVIEL